ncbi:MAG: PAS domain-containing protein [Gammaproteobacteria bacterium]|nr:PAS domain-containing protein [Gammaproteobacteria bacterium]
MLQDLAINIASSVIFLLVGYFFGIYLEKKKRAGKNLDEYEFYPFDLDQKKALQFNYPKFNQAVSHFLKKSDPIAAKQLVLIGNQQNVINELAGKEKRAYQDLFQKYHGKELLEDTVNYLENYKRIVDLIGDTFPDMGIEILLHNLSNPGKALYHIKNNVTGRDIDAPATNLVLDLKTRKIVKQSKLNYELNIGSRKFKCTTIPIYRENYGLVGAICINVDANYIMDVVNNNEEVRTKFFEALCHTDMQLHENILSKLEFEKAEKGKRHFRDFSL